MIRCVYCGGSHRRPAEVKACWATAQAGESASAAVTRPCRGDAGPRALGRNVIVSSVADIPPAWEACRRVVLNAEVFAAPQDVFNLVVDAAVQREALVFVCEVELAAAGQVDQRHPYEVGVSHRFVVDDLCASVLANSIDTRPSAGPTWPLLDAARALGAVDADYADVRLPNGTEVWLDGGPIRYWGELDGFGVLHATHIEHGVFDVPAGNTTDAVLAPDQTAAVIHPSGAARVIAPAGSGKTRVLTERARHLLTRWHLPAESLTMIAFNKRAQLEIVDRTSDLPGLQVRTLNALALSIINGRAPFAPQQRRWNTIDEPHVRRILGDLVSTRRRRNTDPIAPWIEALSQVRLGLVAPHEVERRYGGDVDGLADVFHRFQAELDRAGVVDFDGQIDRALTVLLTDPVARAAAQRACRLLLVDEFQDLTPAHLLLVRLVSSPAMNVFAVGDDDQTIYGYNGADPNWLISYTSWFPGAGDHPLTVNYRCPAPIVEAADRLVRHNAARVPKTIHAHREPSDACGWNSDSSADPVGATVQTVRAALDSGAVAGDVAVLARVNALLAPVQVALTQAGIPFNGGVGAGFAERTSIRAALAWLRLATGQRYAPTDLTEAMRRPSRPVHPRIGEWVAEQRSLPDLLALSRRLTNERDAERVAEFADDIGTLQNLVDRGVNTRQVIDVLCDDIGLGRAVATLDNTRSGMNRASQGDDLLALRQMASQHSDAGTFEAWMTSQLTVPSSVEGVSLATVHRVKGQEWPHVVVHLADVGQFPHRLADDDEEERRLFHVALTRAQQWATVVSGPQPSLMVAELSTEPPANLPSSNSVRERRPKRQKPAPASGGNRPDHPLLDRGSVMAVPRLVLVDQGQEWEIVDVDDAGALCQRGQATRRFAFGGTVQTAGKRRGKLTACADTVAAEHVRAFDVLRSFRDRVRDGKPAYTVFDDKTLLAIALAQPTTLDGLAAVKGVGPAKLERYGDDVLGIIAGIEQ